MAYLTEKVDVEVNGFAFHATPNQQMRDDERRALLQELEWLVVPIAAAMVLRDPRGAVARVRRALELRGRTAK